jgi:hypothetical protein
MLGDRWVSAWEVEERAMPRNTNLSRSLIVAALGLRYWTYIKYIHYPT